jgi:ABC-2 type transport system ATP-binding protein
VRRRTAVLTESPTLDERLTARETLQAFAAMYDVPRTEARPRIDALLDEFGIAERANDRVGGFSRGMKQRLSLAAHSCTILTCSSTSRRRAWTGGTHQLHDTVRQLARTRGRTVVLCTHNLWKRKR